MAGGVLQGESSGAMSVHSLSKFSTLSTCPTWGRNGEDTSLSRSFVQLSDLQVQSSHSLVDLSALLVDRNPVTDLSPCGDKQLLQRLSISFLGVAMPTLC